MKIVIQKGTSATLKQISWRYGGNNFFDLVTRIIKTGALLLEKGDTRNGI